MGNFIANMREEYSGSHSYKYTEDCEIVNIKIIKDAVSNKVEVAAVEYLPTWTFMYYANGVRKYTVVPLPQALASPGDFGITSKRDIGKAQKSFDQTQKLMADAVAKGWISLYKGIDN